MLKIYLAPALDVVELASNDVVTVSPTKGEGTQGDIYGGVWGGIE